MINNNGIIFPFTLTNKRLNHSKIAKNNAFLRVLAYLTPYFTKTFINRSRFTKTTFENNSNFYHLHIFRVKQHLLFHI